MKKLFVVLLVIFMVPFLLLAESMEKPMTVRTKIPEDYSITYPDGAMRLDHMVFELSLETGTETLIEDNGTFSLSFLESGVSALELSLLYYGNQSERYSALVKVDAGDGWVGRMGTQFIPMTVQFKEPDIPVDGISVREVGEGILELNVLPQGPRSGVEFANLIFVWSVGRDAWAGEYEATVNISLEVI